MKQIIFIIIIMFSFIMIACDQKDDHIGHNHQQKEGYYTCPMHPNIVQDDPGSCPICGMDLVFEESDKVVKNETKPEKSTHDHHSDYFTCPMHPNIVQEEPGSCPICGMDLVKESGQNTNSKTTNSENLLYIDPVVVQNMGVRIAKVSYKDIEKTIITSGVVQIPDNRIFSINLKFSGWIEKIWLDNVGDRIGKGEKLFEIYSPNLIAAQEELLLNIQNFGRNSQLAKASEKRLLLWDIPQSHIDRIVESQNAQRNLIYRSRYNGFVIHKNIKEGTFIKSGNDLYHIGNKDRIWITADIYESDINYVKKDAKVDVNFDNIEEGKYSGKIDFIYPTLESKSRTQKIRIELKNSNHKLKPGMFATIQYNVDKISDALTIPNEAIIHTGNKKIVFLSREDGHFLAKEIETGIYDDEQELIEIKSGLNLGETVVLSGQFLLDSESQLKEAVRKLLEARLMSNKEGELPNASGHNH